MVDGWQGGREVSQHPFFGTLGITINMFYHLPHCSLSKDDFQKWSLNHEIYITPLILWSTNISKQTTERRVCSLSGSLRCSKKGSAWSSWDGYLPPPPLSIWSPFKFISSLGWGWWGGFRGWAKAVGWLPPSCPPPPLGASLGVNFGGKTRCWKAGEKKSKTFAARTSWGGQGSLACKWYQRQVGRNDMQKARAGRNPLG